MKKMKIEDKLALNIFHVDEENSHIDVDTEFTDEVEIRKLLLACPAECYKFIDGKLSFSHLGCGTCRVLSHGKIVKSWKHPIGEVGVTFKQG